MFETEQITWLWVLPIVVVLWLAWWLNWQLAWKQLLSYFGGARIASLIPGFRYPVELIRKILLLFALLSFVVALINPRAGIDRTEIETSSINIIVAIDLSYSMLAEDRSPNRLELARQRAIEMIGKLEGNHFAYMPFAGSAELQIPFTSDADAVKSAIRSSRAGMMPVQGSSFASLLDEALDYLDRTGSGVLLIFTDGEDHGPDFSGSLQKMSEKNFPVFGVLIGSDQGAPIPWQSDSGGRYRRDIDGNQIITRMETEPINEISSITGGFWIENPLTRDLQTPIQRINEFRQSGTTQGSFTIYADYYPFFTLAGLLFLTLYQFAPFFTGGQKRPKQ